MQQLIKPHQTPKIPYTVEIGEHNMDLIIPAGYEHIIEATWEDNGIKITCLNPENSFMDALIITSNLFNNYRIEDCTVPKGFIFTNSHNKVMDYFGADHSYVLNMRQVIYLILQNRLAIWSRHDKQYVDLLVSDIRNLRKFLEYNPPVTYNSITKVNNHYAVIKPVAEDLEQSVGEYIDSSDMGEADWVDFMRDVEIDISSETAMSSSHKVVVLQDEDRYKFVGYSKGNDANGNYIKTIFPTKQNIAARLKTHGLSNAYILDTPDRSCFLSNLKTVKQADGTTTVEPLDRCMRKALVVFDHMDKESSRFVAGELESSPYIAETLVHTIKTVDIDFMSTDNPVVQGKTYELNFKPFEIGLDDERNPIFLREAKSVKVLDITMNGSNGLTSLKLQLLIRAGNARIISDSGLKGVTKTKPNLGYICIPKAQESVRNLSKLSLTQLKNSEDGYEEFVAPPEEHEIPVDIIAGMNAVKAKDNSIALAIAAFAVEYGYYTPRLKGGHAGILNDKDEDEINAAIRSVPTHTFYDEFGEERKVQFGIMYIVYTELGSVYSNFKKQSFAFEAGKHLKFNYKPLFEHIWAEYLDVQNVNLALELTKCLHDDRAWLNKVEDEVKLPIYSTKEIRSIFKQDDLVLRKTDLFLSTSKLLDEEWNSKGFYIDLSKYKAPIIRIPSAAILNQMVGQLKSGEFTYHAIITNISKIIMNIIGTAKNPNMSIPFIYDPTGQRHTNHTQYLASLQGTIFSDEEASQMKAQALIKPLIYGVNMKQVVEHRLPPNTLVFMDDNVYKRFCNLAAGEDNPEQIFRELPEDPSVLDMLNVHCPSVYATHSPHLWASQSFAPVIWDRHTYSLYLRITHGINLDDYLYTRTNKDIVLIHPMLALEAKKDMQMSAHPKW